MHSFARAALVAVIGCTYLPAFNIAALALSDVTIASIAIGRLYVIGSTERPYTLVTLENEFKTESNDKGQFQFETIYHPASCIIRVDIEGQSYKAVVSNCAQAGSASVSTTPKRTSPAAPETAENIPVDQNSITGPRSAKQAPLASGYSIKEPPLPPVRPKFR